MKSTRAPLQTRWTRAWMGLLVVCAGCFAMAAYLAGGASWNWLAQTEAAQLGRVTVSELVGTDRYSHASQGEDPTLAPLALSTQPPAGGLLNPIAMLLGQLLPSASSGTTGNDAQGSLFQTLADEPSGSSKVVLGWLPDNTDAAEIQMMEDNPGLTAVSPLWLSLASPDGSVHSDIRPAVVQWAHAHHIDVWALVDNQFNPTLTHQVLSRAASRHHLVAQLIQLAQANQLDGINVDFEAVSAGDRAGFTALMKELHAAAVSAHLVISVDVAPDIAFLRDESAYFHAALSAYADFVVLMAYDEHWGGDQTPGPEADLPWVTQSVEDLLDTGVPATKLVLGMPFYTRFWYVHRDGSVSDEAVPDSNIQSILTAHQATIRWDDNLGVAYATYAKPDGYEEVWYETSQTVLRKLQLVNQDNLAGVAVWSLNLSDAATWHTLLNGLTQILS
ncbi:MAG: glycoside hydrolase [Alicyclobacillus sp.]|nr:glycoside hydrolase [Alicyclobacillus sp.]